MAKRTISLLTAILMFITCLGYVPVMAAETAVAPGVGTLKDAVLAASDGDTLVLTDGIYYVTETLNVNKAVNIVAEDGTMPTITGSTALTGWEEVGDGVYRAAYGETVLPMLIEAGTTATIARWPNKPANANFTGGYIFADAANQNVGAKTGHLTFSETLPAGVEAGSLQMVTWGDEGSNYANTAVQVSAITQGRVDYTGVMKYGVSENTRFYIRGDKGLIDQVGEYALSGGYVYYKPYDATNLETGITASIPFGNLMNITASNVVISGIAIKGTALGTYNSATAPHSDQVRFNDDNMAMNITGRNIVVDSCYFDGIGSLAVKLGGNTNTVSNCKFVNIGSAAISINGANHLITNNDISKTGTENGGGAAVGIAALNTTVSHNAIYDCPRWAINIGYGSYSGNVIEYNDVYNCDTDSSDTGPIYAYQTVATPENPNIIRYNKVHNTPIYGGMGFGIYLDDDCQYFKVYGNVIYNMTESNQGYIAAPLMIKGTAHEIYNNVIANNEGTPSINNAANIMIQQMSNRTTINNKLHHNVVYNPGHPDLYRILLNNVTRAIAQCDYNVYYGSSTNVANGPGWGHVLTGPWHTSYGFENNSKIQDPGFVNGNANDFRLKPDSVLHSMGFEELPLDEMGLSEDFPYADTQDAVATLYVKDTNAQVLGYTIDMAVGGDVTLSTIARTVTGYALSVEPTYTSSNASVISVSADGSLEAKREGNADITATYGGKSVKIKVTATGYENLGAVASGVEYIAPSGNGTMVNGGNIPAGTTGFKVHLKREIADYQFSETNFKVYHDGVLVDGYSVTKENGTTAKITLPSAVSSEDGTYKITVAALTTISGAFADRMYEIEADAAQLSTLMDAVYYLKGDSAYAMSDNGYMEVGTTQIKVKFVDSIEPSTATLSSVVLTKNGVAADYAVDVEDNICMITLGTAVAAGEVYELTLRSTITTTGGEMASGDTVVTVTGAAEIFTVSAPVFKTLNGMLVSGVPAATTITASVDVFNSNAEGKPVMLILALKNENGRVVELSYVAKTVGDHESSTLGAGITTPADTTGLSLDVYLWNGLDTLIPLS